MPAFLGELRADLGNVAVLMHRVMAAHEQALPVGGQSHGTVHGMEMRVQALPLRSDQDQAPGLEGGRQERTTQTAQQVGEIRGMYAREGRGHAFSRLQEVCIVTGIRAGGHVFPVSPIRHMLQSLCFPADLLGTRNSVTEHKT